jgi:hypothetical protein
MKTLTQLQQKFASLWPLLDERTRRLTAASEARALGHGGVSQVSRACGLSRKAIAKGVREIEEGTAAPPGRVRQQGPDPRHPVCTRRLRDLELMGRVVEKEASGVTARRQIAPRDAKSLLA